MFTTTGKIEHFSVKKSILSAHGPHGINLNVFVDTQTFFCKEGISKSKG